MGDNASKGFILRHVFGIELEHIGNVVELLRALLRLHYNKITIPELLSDRLVQMLKQRGVFHEWPLEEIVPDEKAFFAFLQERWPVFLDSLSPKEAYGKSSDTDFKYPGPDVLPFDHQDIRVYIDNLFVEGKLTPVQKPEINIEANSWIRSGIAETKAEYDDLRINRLIMLIEKDSPNRDSRYSDWLEFAMKWAELEALIHQDYQAKEWEQTKRSALISTMPSLNG